MKSLFITLFVSLLFITGCSKKNAATYMDEAKNLLKENKYKEAVLLYEELTKEYPEAPLAAEAFFEMAKLYQAKLVPGVTDIDAYQKAITSYTSVYEKYPDSKEAPLALFMTGFILANEMKQYPAAKQAFEKFIAQYPDHEMLSSAQSELENMGKSPEELLNQVTQP
ncbi:MAG: tetratricopeptide repeat protein [Ignavibacteriales bacterium]|nr:tetratricopeptide repeat protein [Ignavibacteriaceae bacterium]QOJ29113.1 MAG: tetratricopeptide repeat protein [Ignavibacteriales bacterium]